QYLSGLLEKLPAVGERMPRDLSLLEPIDAAWIVASIAVGYDEARDRILVVANELLEEEESADPASARVLITRAQAAAFVKQADDVGLPARSLQARARRVASLRGVRVGTGAAHDRARRALR